MFVQNTSLHAVTAKIISFCLIFNIKILLCLLIFPEKELHVFKILISPLSCDTENLRWLSALLCIGRILQRLHAVVMLSQAVGMMHVPANNQEDT